MSAFTQFNLLIDGKSCEGRGGKRITIINPATGVEAASVAQGGAEDVDSAVKAAQQSFDAGSWRKATPTARGVVLRKIAALVRANAEELALLETQQTGKPITDSRGEVGACAAFFDYYAGVIPTFGGETVPVSSNGTALTFREPVGVCAQIIPWNFPIVITSWKAAPALAMGNSIVVKPAPATPLTAIRLAEIALEAGLPPGVFNVVPGGDDTGAALSNHPGVRKISFTGSTAVGKEVMRAAASNIKRVSLELGGKSASMVFADADLEKVAAGVSCVFDNAGQDCCARSRMLIERPIYQQFIEKFVENTRKLKMGDVMDPSTQFGSLISKEHRARVDGYVKKGIEQGAKLVLGGKAATGGVFDAGAFYEPTVFADTTPDMTIVREEIFGPVVCMMPFDTEDEAIRLANDSAYGLSGSLWTRDIARVLRVVRAVQTGVISVNCHSSVHKELPFGGFKESGMGKELGIAALEHYSELKSIFISAD